MTHSQYHDSHYFEEQHDERVFHENRTSPRRRVLRAGKVVLDNGAVYDCMVRNISDTGAQIRIVEPIPLPVSFSVYWMELQVIRQCDNRWQRGRDCGVEFTSPERPTIRDFRH